MSDYTWPTDRLYLPKTNELLAFHNNRATVSPLSGYTQSNSLPGSRWGWMLGFGDQLWGERAKLEGFFAKLSGMEHRAVLYDWARPRPLGTINLTGVTASAASQFATQLTLNGVVGDNLLTAWESLDNAAWTKTNVTIAANSGTAPDGTPTGDALVETSDTGVHQVFQTSAAVSSAAGAFTLSCLVRPQTRTRGYLQLIELTGSTNITAHYTLSGAGTVDSTSAGANWSGVSATIARDPRDASWYQLTLTGTKTNAATSMSARVGSDDASGNPSYAGSAGSEAISAWGAKLQTGSSATAYARPTMLSGDWLGVGGQLLMAAADATASDLGVITSLEIRHMLRAAVSGGASVTLDKPTSKFMLAEPPSFPRAPGRSAGQFSARFVEAW